MLTISLVLCHQAYGALHQRHGEHRVSNIRHTSRTLRRPLRTFHQWRNQNPRSRRARKEPRAFHSHHLNASQQHATDRVMEKAEWQADRSRQRGRNEDDVPTREMKAVRSPSADRGEIGTTLPVVEEAGESSSVGGHSNRSTSNATLQPPSHSPPAPPLLNDTHLRLPHSRSRSRNRDESHGRPPPTPPKDSGTASTEGEERPPTPPKDEGFVAHRHSGPPTPPKEMRGRSPPREKDLPSTPFESAIRVS
jgi:1-phosphatidylinositol-4-phosphate 5-kinase